LLAPLPGPPFHHSPFVDPGFSAVASRRLASSASKSQLVVEAGALA